jgi:hypothetical protein
MYYILVICLIQAQPIVFQDKEGVVYIIDEDVKRQKDEVMVPGDDILTLVDADGAFCQPDGNILGAVNLRILLTSSPRVRNDRRWLTQDIDDDEASYIVGPWLWDECAVASFVISV